MGVLSIVRRYVVAVFALVVITWSGLFLLDEVTSLPASVGPNAVTAVHVGVILTAMVVVVLIIRRLRSTLGTFMGSHVSAMITFFMVLVTVIAASLAVLSALHVPTDTLLLGGGILSVVIGLVVSTLFGNIISGALMLTTFPFRIGDSVLVNNIPGRIEEITTLYTKISNNSGSDTIIPNNAIVSGAVSISHLPTDARAISNRLHYSVGDRIYTSYIGGEGTVTEITPYSTQVMLDSGREAAIPNNSIFTAAVQIAKIREPSDDLLAFQLKIDWNAEKTIEAMKTAATDASIFKSPLQVQYSSIEGALVELRVTSRVNPSLREEAKSVLLRAAYLVSH